MRKREVSLIGKSEQNPKFQISHLHLLTVTAGGGVSGLVPLTMIIDSEELLRNLLLYLSKTGNLQRMVSLLIVLVFWLVQALRLLRREKLPFKIGGLVISVILAEISFDQWSDYVTKQLYRHFGLNWAFVDPKAPIKSGTKFCVCVKEFFPWLMMPLQVVYVTENKNSKNGASFSFGSGTLQGHLLTYRKCECEFINHGTVNYGHFLGHSPSSPTTKKKKIEMVIYICFLFMTQKRNMQPILLFCSHLSRFYEMHNFVATMLKGLLVPGIVTIMQLV